MDTNSLIKKVIECCYIVHRELGHGFNEKIYERSLEIVLKEGRLNSSSQYPIVVNFHDHIVGEYFADLYVEGTLIIELKAVAKLDTSHKSQVINYLKASGNRVGLLVNFGAPKLEICRLYNNDANARLS